MQRTICLLLLLGIGLFTVPPAGAWPIPPLTLWPLVEQSDLIVIARVKKVVPLPKSDDTFGNSHMATLEVAETLKGHAAATLEVPYPGNWICPAPPLFLEKETVVAFLTRGEDGQPAAVGLSYGTLYPQGKNALEDFRVMVRSALAIQEAHPAQPALAAQKLDWLVDAAVRPGTRWHGLYELDPSYDQPRSHYDPNSGLLAGRLQSRHRARLALAFLTTNVAAGTLPKLLQILADQPDPRVDAAAMEWIEGLLAADDQDWLAREMIEILLFRLGDAAPQTRMLDEKGEKDWSIEPERLRAIWAKAKADLDLPTYAPRAFVPERLLPVGAGTPP